jgi:DNA-binding LacI/PurR family transcriptional regulator
MGNGRPTSSDVAAAAGVSRATVSYVLNRRTDVPIKDATRKLVLEAAEQLGYQPSPAARALRVGHGEVVLVLLPGWAEGQFSDVLAELGHRISRHGLVCLRHEGAQWEGNLGQLLARVTVAAVVTFEPLTARDSETLDRSGIPEARVWWLDNPGQRHTTAIDQAEVVQRQVEHLLDRGYQNLAYLALESPPAQRFMDVRIAAFRQTCQERGIPGRRVAIEAANNEAVVARIRSWRSGPTERLGICAWSDVTAVAVLNAARALDLDVPEQLGVVGVDDSVVAQLAMPALSSVRLDLAQDAALVGRNVARALGLEEPQIAWHDPLTLIARAST